MVQWAGIALAVLALVGTGHTHHGWSSYDEGQTVTVAGPVEEVHFEHPHVTVRVRGEDRPWRVVLPPPTRAVAMGLSADLVRPGRRAVAVGHPHRAEAGEMRALRITVGDRAFRLR